MIKTSKFILKKYVKSESQTRKMREMIKQMQDELMNAKSETEQQKIVTII